MPGIGGIRVASAGPRARRLAPFEGAGAGALLLEFIHRLPFGTARLGPTRRPPILARRILEGLPSTLLTRAVSLWTALAGTWITAFLTLSLSL